ncbi:MAG: ABC transporter ATP-binding protein [Planctomycetota bacterium]|nr:MAG: ABC transporter ATP-binding protein [Planctomycetota bacterium]
MLAWVKRATTDRDILRLASELMSKNIVEFKSVTKTYNVGRSDAFTAISDVTFEIEDLPGKGEFITVLGPSGCGKSTVLRMIAGLEPQHPPTSGSVLVSGTHVMGPGPERGMVFQDYTSFDNRTVLDNVAFGLECRGVDRATRYEKAREWIQRVGLDVQSDAGKYPHELSGGMRQRVAIARTLILHPRIILMDEPFGALDPQTRQQMQDLLIQLWNDVEATVFFVTHSIEEAVYLGDRIFIFSPGPGRLAHQIPILHSTVRTPEIHRNPDFQRRVLELSEIMEQLESKKP